MRNAWKLVLLVIAAYFCATFIHHYIGRRLLELPGPQNIITFFLVPIIFFSIVHPLIRAHELPRISIRLGKSTSPQWAVLAGLCLGVTNWAITNLIVFGNTYRTSSPIASAAIVDWECHWPIAVIPELLLKTIPIPVMEEICFRGLIMGIFLARGRPKLGLFVSTFTFAAYHPNYVQACVTGVVLGLIYWRTQQLGLAILAHVAHNFLVAVDHLCIQIDWIPAQVWGIAAIALVIAGIATAVWALRQLPKYHTGPPGRSNAG